MNGVVGWAGPLGECAHTTEEMRRVSKPIEKFLNVKK